MQGQRDMNFLRKRVGVRSRKLMLLSGGLEAEDAHRRRRRLATLMLNVKAQEGPASRHGG
ncbi:hypothetical protein CUJ84_pRLN3000280 (plasmid) [Rhizobium leguminosarum]|uniref:Uncharacterized protein n=1 Tax=Rhizobium leguminosarum TaxID=384 RepID=A0A2K9ZGM6_RHILE|nr:hypothetical protein CUJ84_pRLN3000280 [Rhizobium leguminosarum]